MPCFKYEICVIVGVGYVIGLFWPFSEKSGHILTAEEIGQEMGGN